MSASALAQLLGNNLYYKRFFPYFTWNLCVGLDPEGTLSPRQRPLHETYPDTADVSCHLAVMDTPARMSCTAGDPSPAVPGPP